MRVLDGPWTAWDADLTAVAVGVFDGVHLGHRAVLDHVMADGLVPAVLTFDPHPVAVVAPQHAPLILTPLRRKIELFDQAGLSVVGVVTFDSSVQAMTPDAFCSQILVDGLGAKRVVVGADFHFGKDRAGTAEVLSGLGDRLGFETLVVPLVGDGEPISSSAIRGAVAEGRVEDAARWLGRPFRVTGEVARGARRGVEVGFPTANLEVAPSLARPGHGVYAVVAYVEGERHLGVANVGVRPTFGGTEEVVEAHLFDFDDEIYGAELSVDFISRIRDEIAFSGPDALVAQIASDVETARQIHGS